MTNVSSIYGQVEAPATLHLRHDGRSHDVNLAVLGVTSATPDSELKAAVSAHFDLNYNEIQKLVVERLENGNITLRPEAVFG